ncbi:DinB family protein [Mucilaginibacter sp.]|uniref:DinB family protein n=1 Tax=Mucilaginibacter sp. TaxID=1882438 RepID=UPI003D0DDF17
MTISEELRQDLENVLSGAAWYGTPIYTIIDEVSFETAYEKPPGSVHNIANIVLHMLSWTEEVMDRMNGMNAQRPSSGDWPHPGDPDEEKWQTYVSDLKLVNVNLLKVIQDFPEEQWNEPINYDREGQAVATYKQTVVGFIQHQVYHTGQIALLKRIING